MIVARRRGARRGLPRRLRRAARRARGARRLRRRRPARRDAVRLARAVLPPRAARRRAPTRSSRPASRRVVVASDDPTEKASGRGLGILRDEGVEVVVADGELAARARLLNQPFRKHARTGRPCVLFKSAMTLDGKVATRTGDSKWISGEDVAPARAPLARRVRRRRGRHRHRAGRRPAADRPHRRRRAPAAPRSCSTPRRACRSTPSSCAARAEVPLTVVVSRAAPRARRPTRWRSPGAEVIVATGENEPGARALRARPARRRRRHARSCSRAARTSRARSSTPARSTRSACSSRRSCSAARSARDPLEGEGVERIAEAARALTLDVRARRRRRADHRAPAGVVSACSPGWSQDLGTVDGRRRRRPTACASRVAHARSPASSPRATRSRSTASA